MNLGIKVRLADPEDPANIINAQFATVRTHPELKQMLYDIAKLDREESVAIKAALLAAEDVDRATDRPSLEAAAAVMEEAAMAQQNASERLLEAVRRFVVQGFVLAGADQERAELLASLVPASQLAELRAICQYGAGSLDFTQAGR